MGWRPLATLLIELRAGAFYQAAGLRQITHLLFANDTLVFCEASLEQMVFLSWLLMWFEAISSLRINLDKSEILLVGRVDNVEDLALELSSKIGVLPSYYLGLPLGAAHNPMAVWDVVEERF